MAEARFVRTVVTGEAVAARPDDVADDVVAERSPSRTRAPTASARRRGSPVVPQGRGKAIVASLNRRDLQRRAPRHPVAFELLP